MEPITDKELERRRKVSSANKKRGVQSDIKKKIIMDYSNGMTGKDLEIKYGWSDSTIFNILHERGVEVRTGKFQKGHKTNLGKKLNLSVEERERRRQLGLSHKGKIRSDKVKKEQSIRNSGNGNPNYGNRYSHERKLEMSMVAKKLWDDPSYVKKWKETHQFFKQNRIEKCIDDVIVDYGFKYVGDGSFWIGYPPRNPDFINRESRLIFEFFGDYWHNRSDESERIDHYRNYGWGCIIVWESDLSYKARQGELSDDDKSFILNSINGWLK